MFWTENLPKAMALLHQGSLTQECSSSVPKKNFTLLTLNMSIVIGPFEIRMG